MTSIGPGPESVDVQLYAAAPTAARWDRAVWDGGAWGAPAWQSVDCDVIEASYVRGVTDEAGVLSQSAAGPMDLATLDPNRELDPSNADGPYFGAVAPGTPLRLVGGAAGAMVGVWAGYVDEASYDVASQRGRVRCVDAIALLAQTQIPDGTALPNTLRARVRAIVAAVGLAVPVVPEVALVQLLRDPSFEAVPTDPAWTNVAVGSGSGSQANSGAPDGARVLRMNGAAGGSSYRQVIASPPIPGAVYSFAGTVFRNTGSVTAPQVLLRGRDTGGTLIGPVSTLTAVTTQSWEPLTGGSWTCPTDGSIASLELWCSGGGNAADVHYFDALSVVGPDPLSSLGVDPPVAPFDGKAVSAWTAIQNAALDALTLVWLDPDGTIRFTSWGALPDASVSIGCPPAGEPAAAWIGGLSTIQYAMSAGPIRNRVRAYSALPSTWQPYQDDAASIARYGARSLDVDRVVPDFATWSGRILADRADAGLDVTLGEVRPYSLAELLALLAIGTTGPQVVRVADSDHGTPIDDSVGIVGTAGRVTSAGWSFRYVTMIPRADWDAVEPPPVTPPIPPPDPYHQETRTYIATSDALLALTSGGSKYGAGAASSLPVGSWQGWTYRACIQLPAIPWTKVRRVVSATLRLQTTTQVRVGFGSSPTIEIQRITGSWSAGSSSSPSGSNSVVYPGPTTTTAGAKRTNMPTGQNAGQNVDVTAIATAWAPSAIGGSAAAQRGVMLLPGSGSGVDTTEVWPTEQGGAARPTLTLVVEVFD